MKAEGFFKNSNRVTLHPHGKSSTNRPIHKLLKSAVFSSLIVLSGGCSNLQVLMDPVSDDAHSQRLLDLEQSFQAEHLNKKDSLSLKFLKPDVFRPFMDKGTALTNTDFKNEIEDYVGYSVQSNNIQNVLKKMQLGAPEARVLLNTETQKIESCLIVPAASEGISELLQNTSVPYLDEQVTSNINFENGEFESFAQYHELWHCVFFDRIKEDIEQNTVPFADMTVLRHITESISDIAGIIDTMQQGYPDTLTKVRDFRNSESIFAVLSDDLASAVGHYTVRAIDELERRLETLTPNEFQNLKGEKLQTFVFDIMADVKLNSQELKSFTIFLATKPADATQWLKEKPEHQGSSKIIAEYLDSLETTLTSLNSAKKHEFMFGRPDKGRPRKIQIGLKEKPTTTL